MSDENEEEHDGDNNPIKYSPMREMVKETVEECQTSEEGVELLIDQLEFLGKQIWTQASRHVIEDGRVRVQEDDVQTAYDELRHPHDLLKNSADDMRDMARDLDSLAEQSPIYASIPDEDEDDE